MKKILQILFLLCFVVATLLHISCDSGDYGEILVGGDRSDNAETAVPIPSLRTDVETCKVSYVEKPNGNIEVSVNEHDGYAFAGWYVEKENNRLYISNASIELIDLKRDAYREYITDGKLHIVACFDAMLHVEYLLEGGEFDMNGASAYLDTREEAVALPRNVYREGFYFVGWRDASGNLIDRVAKGMSGEVVLRAEWCNDYRDALIGKVWETTYPVPGEFMPVAPKLTFEFVDGEQVYVYAKVGDAYFDVGRAHLSFIHTLSYYSTVRHSDTLGARYHYNDWDFGNLRADGSSAFHYKITDEHILLYLASDDEIYARYIDRYYNWNLYTLTYDSVRGTLQCLTLDTNDEQTAQTLGNVCNEWYELLMGNDPEPMRNVFLSYVENEDATSTEITNSWEDMYRPCDMDIDGLKNTLSRDAETKGLLLITDYNQMLEGWSSFVDVDGIEKYALASLISVNDAWIGMNYFVVKDGDGYSVAVFFPFYGFVANFSEEGFANTQMHIEKKDGKIELIACLLGEDGAVLERKNCLFEETFYILSAETETVYWMFDDRKRDYTHIRIWY